MKSVVRATVLCAPTAVALSLLIAKSIHAYPGDVFSTAGPAQATPVSSKGEIPSATHSVSPQTGAAQYSVPIIVPPGRQGVEPQLALTYNSQGGTRGGIAVGWGLSIPTIYVDTSQGRMRETLYASSLAGGQRLVEVDEPNAMTGVRSFRAIHDDSWARYEKVVLSVAGEVGTWRVRQPDGSVLYFGEGDSRDRATPGGTGTEARWFLSRSVDRFGNTAEYEWAPVSASALNGNVFHEVDRRLARISYTSNPGAGLGPHAEVQFVYSAPQSCPGSAIPVGAAFDYRTGIRLYRGYSKLIGINTFVRDSPGASLRRVSEYDLLYDEDAERCDRPYAPMRVLSSIARTGFTPHDQTTGTAAPVLTFSYGEASGGQSPFERQFSQTRAVPPAVSAALGHSLGSGARRYNSHRSGGWPTLTTMLRDVDGDGRIDVVVNVPVDDPTSAGSCALQWRRNLGNGSFGEPEVVPMPTVAWADAVPGDLEGCSLAGQFSRKKTPGMTSPNVGANYLSYRHMDLDADGQDELVTALDYRFDTFDPNSPLEVLSRPAPSTPVPEDNCVQPNGDLVQCLLRPMDLLAVFLDEPVSDDDVPACDSGCRDRWCLIVAKLRAENPANRGGLSVPDFLAATCQCSLGYCASLCTSEAAELDSCSSVDAPPVPKGPWDDPFTSRPPVPFGPDMSPEGTGSMGGTRRQRPESFGGKYVLRVHDVDGAGTVGAESFSLSPIPLESSWATARMGGGVLAEASSWHGFADMDGDGNLDAVFQHPLHMLGAGPSGENGPLEGPGGWSGELMVFLGDGDGAFRGRSDGKAYLFPGPPTVYRARIQRGHNGLASLDGRTLQCSSELGPHESCMEYRISEQYTELRDINGDGLADYIETRVIDGERKLRVFYNTGAGFESGVVDGNAIGTVLTDDFESLDLVEERALKSHDPTGYMQGGWSQSVRRSIDIDQDGLVDVVKLPGLVNGQLGPFEAFDDPSENLVVYFNMGDRFFPVEIPQWNQHMAAFARINVTGNEDGAGVWRVITDVLDFDGDGRLDLFGGSTAEQALCHGDSSISPPIMNVYGCQASGTYATDPAGIGARMLRTVENGRGGSVTFDYTNTSDATVVSGFDESHRIPAPVWVVDKVTTHAGSAAPPSTLSYYYDGPVSNRDEIGRFGFRGFERNVAVGSANESGLSTRTVQHYDYSIDPTGRLVSTELHEDGGSAGPTIVSVSDTRWQRHELFDGAVTTYHPSENRNFTCPLDASNDDADLCRDADIVVRTTTSWGPMYARGGSVTQLEGFTKSSATSAAASPTAVEELRAFSFVAPAALPVAPRPTATISVGSDSTMTGRGGDPFVDAQAQGEYLCDLGAPAPTVPGTIVMYVPCGIRVTDTLGDVRAGDRGTVTDHTLLSDYETFLLLPTQSRRYLAIADGTGDSWNAVKLLGWDTSVYEDDELGRLYESRSLVEATTPGDFDTVIARQFTDPRTGNTIWTQSPRNVRLGEPGPGACGAGSSGLVSCATYDVFELYPAVSMTPGGHRTRVHVDIGTGLTVVEGGVEQPNAGNAAHEVHTTYDGLGRPTLVERVVSPGAAPVAISTFEYEDSASAGATSVTARVRLDFDEDRWLTSQTLFDGLGRVLEEITDPGGMESRVVTTYDAAGQVVSVEMPEPNGIGTVTYGYTRDSRGRITTYTPPTGATVEMAYDGLYVTRTEVPTEVASLPAPAGVTQLTYDVFGRLSSVIEDMGGTGSVNAETRYTYDASDNLVGVRDADGIVTTLEYDMLGRRISVTRGAVVDEAGTPVEGRTLRTWRYRYDENGNLVCERPPLPDPLTLAPEHVFEVAALSDELCAVPNAPSEWEILTTYDQLDRTVSRYAGKRALSDADADRFSLGHTVYEYDNLSEIAYGWGRLRRVRVGVKPDGSEFANLAYDYDFLGQGIEETRTIRATPWADYKIYDERTTRVSYNALGAVESTVHGDDAVDPTITSQTYESSRGLPHKLFLEPSAAATGAFAVELVELRRNVTGRLTRRISRAPFKTQYQVFQYDKVGRVKEQYIRAVDCDGCSMSPVAGEIVSFWSTGDVRYVRNHKAASDGGMLMMRYLYDNQHQLTSATSDSDGGLTYNATFSYSPAGRVQVADVDSSVTGFDVFPRTAKHLYADDLTAPDSTPDPSAVRALLDLDAADPESAPPLATFDYDERGGLSRRTAGSEAISFVYDGDDLLREVVNETAGSREIYYYDHRGQRMLSFRTAFETDAIRARQFFGSTEIEYRAEGASMVPNRTVVHTVLGAMRIAQIVDGDRSDPRFTYNGVLGHLLAVVNTEARPIARFVYGPFGELLRKSGDDVDNQHKRFNGKEFDDITRLSYYGYRYYDRLSMSWTQMDPLYRFSPDIAYDKPLELGLYTFSLNNPLRYVDPDGRQTLQRPIRDPGDHETRLLLSELLWMEMALNHPYISKDMLATALDTWWAWQDFKNGGGSFEEFKAVWTEQALEAAAEYWRAQGASERSIELRKYDLTVEMRAMGEFDHPNIWLARVYVVLAKNTTAREFHDLMVGFVAGVGMAAGGQTGRMRVRGQSSVKLRFTGLKRALKARNAEVKRIKEWGSKKRNSVATVIGAADPRTGKVTVGVKKTGCDRGKCAEDLAADQLGNPDGVEFTPAVRPRNNQIIKRCDRCTNTFGPE